MYNTQWQTPNYNAYSPYQMPNFANWQTPNTNSQFQANNAQNGSQGFTQQPVNTNKIYVSSLDEVKMRSLPPNSSYIFLDNDKSVIYQKTVDGAGQFDVKVFDIVPHTEEQKVDEQYALKKDFDAFYDEFRSFQAKLIQSPKEIVNGK